jgi:paraquat-inducible protein B
MRERSRQFKIGLFVLAAAAVFVGALFAFGVERRLQRKVRLETYVAGNVDGLGVGSRVTLKGVSVGEVTKISFSWIEYPGGDPPCVVVYFDVAEAVVPSPSAGLSIAEGVRRGLRAIVTTQGITGSAFLALEVVDPARNPPLKYSWNARNEVIPSAESQLSRIIASAEKAVSNLERLDVAQVGARLDRTLQTADELLGKVSRIDFEQIGTEVQQATATARAAAREFQKVARDARGTLSRMQLDAIAGDARRLLGGLEESNARVQRLVDRLGDVDVRELNGVLASTRDAARRLNDTVEQLNRYPSGFFFGKEPDPVRSLDSSRP